MKTPEERAKYEQEAAGLRLIASDKLNAIGQAVRHYFNAKWDVVRHAGIISDLTTGTGGNGGIITNNHEK